MSNPNGQYVTEAELRVIQLTAIATLLREFFGVTSSSVQDWYSGPSCNPTITCSFEAVSKDGRSRESREYLLKRDNSPEENLRILLSALDQRRWYENQRDEKFALRADQVPSASEIAVEDFEIAGLPLEAE